MLNESVFLDLTWNIGFGEFSRKSSTSCTAPKKRGVRTLHLSNVRITSNGLLKILLALFECGTRGSCTLRTFMVELLPYESRSFFTNAVRNFFAFFSNYRNGKNPVLQRPQLLPPPSFDGAFEGHRSFKKLFFPFVAYARVVTIKRFHHYFTTLPNWRRK